MVTPPVVWSTASGYVGSTSKPPMPPVFMTFSSRRISVCVTAGPNHHHRTIIRASSGGL